MRFFNEYINQLFEFLKDSQTKKKVYWIDETNLVIDSEKLALECLRYNDDAVDYKESINEFSNFINEFQTDFDAINSNIIYLHYFIKSENDRERIKSYLKRLSETNMYEVLLYSLCLDV